MKTEGRCFVTLVSSKSVGFRAISSYKNDKTKRKGIEGDNMANVLSIMERKYQKLDAFYNSLSVLGKLLCLVGVAAILLIIGAVVVPSIYKAGESFGAYLYNNFSSN
ncbi:hypothetical protein [Streptococcus fryi]